MKHQFKRRRLLQWAATAPFLPGHVGAALAGQPAAKSSAVRCRPGDAGWPSADQWQALREQVGGRLLATALAAASLRAGAIWRGMFPSCSIR